MTISDIGTLAGSVAKEYVRMRTHIISQRAEGARPLLKALSINEHQMRAFLRYSAKRGGMLNESLPTGKRSSR
jgi:hypothetical protein